MLNELIYLTQCPVCGRYEPYHLNGWWCPVCGTSEDERIIQDLKQRLLALEKALSWGTDLQN